MKKDPYRYFLVEAREILEGLTRGALDLEKGAIDHERVAQMLRLTHTLKGAAQVVKQPSIAGLAHAIEDLFGPHREAVAPLSRPTVDSLLRLVDQIAAAVAALDGAPQVAPEPAAPGGTPTASPRSALRPLETVRVDLAEVDSLLQEISHAVVEMRAVRQCAGTLESSGRIAASLVDNLGPRRGARSDVPAAGTPPHRVRLIAEELLESIQRARRDLAVSLDRAETDLRLVQSKATRVRLIPAGGIFGSLERAARDAAGSSGRRIAFGAGGQEIRVDGHVLSILRDALLHAVRNAVDHGIEDEADRSAAGKPPEGRVQVRVERRGHRLAFTCTDDGRGIDVEAVRLAAIGRGLVTPDQGAALGPEEVARLILHGGLSTSKTVTAVSGRGVGMDVVREAADRLKGSVSVRSRPGLGTTVGIEVPISLSSVRALLVEDAGGVASLPLDAVAGTLCVSESAIARTPSGDTILYDGRAIPFTSLGRALWKRDGEAVAGPAHLAVLLRSGESVAALAVDRFAGVAEVVVMRLPEIVGDVPGVAGACLDEEGNPRLVLDPEALVRAAGAETGRRLEVIQTAPRSVLVVDDSLTTRMLEQSILESAGYEVDLATSGQEALDMAHRREYGLFVVDVEMPGMDGFEFITSARADAALSRVPAILLTSRSSEEDRRRGVEVGAKAFIVKSQFDQAQLLSTIRGLTT
ncbi:MAG TPA: response regulator [Candidatus Polarisedimenticolia bacterium]|jgi:two-component system chemotaxis sensor kinase CheA